ncbi:MAG: response regulator [Candidatus Izimaplasma sp.]|nr:response regulator [Candidatus Izimaplasma bacterium]
MKPVYKLILVDDEDEVRGRIASRISKDIGFEIVGKAGNGYDALELIEKLKPDVVLTDIKMPFIDGIELARIIRRDYPMIRVAFITGYDEFNYAKKAVELHVVKYLMKPVTSHEINTFLKELKQSLDEEYRNMKDLMIVKEKYEQLLPLIGDSFLSSLINDTTLTPYHIDKLGLYGIDVSKYKGFITCLVQTKNRGTYDLKRLEQLKVNANEMFKSIFSKAKFKHSLLVAEGLVFVFTIESLTKNKIDTLLFELIESAREYLDVELLIGVSKPYDEFNHFPISYRQSKKALGYANSYDFGNIVYADELITYDKESKLITLEDYANFDQLLHYGTTQLLQDEIEKIKNRIRKSDVFYDLPFLQIEIGHLIIHLASKAEVSLDNVIDGDLLITIQRTTAIDELFSLFEEVLLTVKALDIRKQLTRSEKLTQEAIAYIDEHYNDTTLTLEQLSDHLNVSLSHLSMLFKKNSGYTFSKYLIKVRMQKAEEYLSNTDLKIADIALLCGYSDVYYFSHSFKKHSGLSPRMYRKQ